MVLDMFNINTSKDSHFGLCINARHDHENLKENDILNF